MLRRTPHEAAHRLRRKCATGVARSQQRKTLTRLRKAPNFFRHVWILFRRHTRIAQLDIGGNHAGPFRAAG
jgi:hypothetical protein